MRQTELWTIYDADTGDALEFHAFMGADVMKDAKVITSPVERGSFVAYNKVLSPDSVAVNGALKGTADTLSEGLDALEELASGTRLVNIVTPDHVYRGYTLYKLDYSRNTDDGTDVIFFTASFQEVKQTEGTYTTAAVGRGRRKRGQQQGQEESVAHMIGRWIG